MVSEGGSESIVTTPDSIGCVNTDCLVSTDAVGVGMTEREVDAGSLMEMEDISTTFNFGPFRFEILEVGSAAYNGTEGKFAVCTVSLGGNESTEIMPLSDG